MSPYCTRELHFKMHDASSSEAGTRSVHVHITNKPLCSWCASRPRDFLNRVVVRLFLSAPECDFCFDPCPNKARQGGKRTRARAKQNRCESALTERREWGLGLGDRERERETAICAELMPCRSLWIPSVILRASSWHPILWLFPQMWKGEARSSVFVAPGPAWAAG